MTELFRNEYIVITREHNHEIVRMKRTKQPITVEAFALLGDIFQQLFSPAELREIRLLIDSRDAPLSRDPELERQTGALMLRFDALISRRVVLVKTAVGRLQSTRINRERGTNNLTFDDEAEAIQFLLQAQTAAS